MRPLGNGADLDESPNNNKNVIPAVYSDSKEKFPLKKSIAISSFAHPSILAMLWIIIKLIIIILAILGISLSLFEKPKPKMNDIEFVLVNKEAQPINKHTKFRSDRNSRAGGKHDPKRAVSMPQASSPKSASAHRASAPVAKQSPAPRPIMTPKQLFKKFVEPPAPRPAMQHSAPPRPTMEKSIPRPTLNNKSNFSIPIPKSSAPKVAKPSNGSGSSSSRGTALGTSGRGSAPSPMMSPSRGSGSRGGSGASGGRYSSSYSMGGGGSVGNPGPGNPHGAPGIDAIKEPDFGPYMRELQRRIKRNWDPPRGNESKRVVLMFKIGKDGRLLSVKVAHSSGVPSADQAAISAVEITAPFSPLPPEYRGSNIDIQFTFDYNVFGGSRY